VPTCEPATSAHDGFSPSTSSKTPSASNAATSRITYSRRRSRAAPPYPRRVDADGSVLPGEGVAALEPSVTGCKRKRLGAKDTASPKGVEPRYYAAMQRAVDDTQPMTGEQAATLKRLAQAAYELDAFKPNLTRAEADLRIATLAAKLKLLDGPPHAL